MVSIYLHLPFCIHKCPYCSFFVMPTNELAKEKLQEQQTKYLGHLRTQITLWKELLPQERLKTLYIGGGTPLQLGKARLLELIAHTLTTWGSEFLEELTIEWNPDPLEGVITAIKEIGDAYPQLYRLRHSIGIQSFDDAVLKASKRNYTFEQVQEFLRSLQSIKQQNRCYNLDFIAFGMEQDGKTQDRWDDEKRAFFQRIAKSQTFDSFSVYSLEHSQGSDWYHMASELRPAFDDETQTEEYITLQTMLLQAGYTRYELSNYALAGKRSIHNMAYRLQEPYLGLGINATSCLPMHLVPEKLTKLAQGELKTDSKSIRFQTTNQRKKWDEDEFPYTIGEVISPQLHRFEHCLLGLRTDRGVEGCASYADLLVPNWETQVADLCTEGFATYDAGHLVLTTLGMNVYNTIITNLFGEQVRETKSG